MRSARLPGFRLTSPEVQPCQHRKNVTLSGTTEGIDVRWNIPPGSEDVANYQIAYQAMERQRADSWTYMWTQGKTSTHLIRHLAGGYEYRVYVRSCSTTQCNSEWAYGGTTWTKKPRSVTYNPVLTPTPTPTPTATPTPYPQGIDPWLQLSWYEARHTDEGYLRPIMYYVVMRWTGSNTGRLLQVAWREASSGGEWNTINREDVSYDGIQNLKPATDYEVKARRRLLEFDEDYRPWSETYTVRTSDVPAPEPCAPDTGTLLSILRGGFLYPYADLGNLGRSVWVPVVFVNPDQQEWTYKFRSRWRAGSSYVEVSINQDGQWTFTIQFGWNDPIITTGQVDNFDRAHGARNRFAFSIPSSGLASGGGWYYGQFKMYVNDEAIPIEVPERILENLRSKSRDVYVHSSATVKYEDYKRCRHWWHYW